MERRGKKLLGPGAVVAISIIEGELAVAAALPEIDNTWPSERRERRGRQRWGGERGKEVTVVLRIRGRINGPFSKTVWVESQ